ncbi:MAG TPA: FAD-dependent monooxygenase [Streptosporangiaceae bacterium]|nr:FAD-dependent monooxygenase [Streptosporangiaceae bacterium]
MWDAVIVGARCAGASAALLLARRGQRVLLVDRATFPSDTMSTLYIHQPGIELLDRWGVLAPVIASGCPRLDSIKSIVQDVELRGPVAAYGNVTANYAPRRYILDQLLIEAAVAAGAEFAEGVSLSEVLWEDGRVAGVRLRAKDGGEICERTGLVIGADGMRSRLAELVGAPYLIEDPSVSCVYYTGWTGMSCGFETRVRSGSSAMAAVPTNDGVTILITYFPQDSFRAIKLNPRKAHLGCIRELAPELFEELSAGEQAIRLQGTGDQRNFFRQAHGPGWVLTGDAGLHLDSITAQGITHAFVQADLLSESLGDDLQDAERVDGALCGFATQTRSMLADEYSRTLEAASLHVPSSRVEALREISQVPALTERYFALIAGLISVDDFLLPELTGSLDLK